MSDTLQLEDLEKPILKDGVLTQRGVSVDGEIVYKRAGDSKFKKLTYEQQMTLDNWTKKAMVDFPEVEKFYIESIFYKCIIDPKGTEQYAKDNYHKLYEDEDNSGEQFKQIVSDNSNVSFYK